jgi:hypothetical protein
VVWLNLVGDKKDLTLVVGLKAVFLRQVGLDRKKNPKF